jgi:methyl-accepting chemotaxis protein
MFQSRSMRAKMLATSLVLAFFLILVGGTGIVALRLVSDNYGHVARVNLANAMALYEMEGSALEVSRSYLRLAIPGNTAEEVKKRIGIIDSSIADYEKNNAAYKAVDFVEGEQPLYDTMDGLWKTLVVDTHKAVELLQTGPEATEKFRDDVTHHLSELRAQHGEATDKLIDFQRKQSALWVDKAEKARDAFQLVTAVAVVLGALIALVLGFLSSGQIANALRSVSKEIRESGVQVRSASEQLSVASQQLSSGATQAASALEETVASVEELSSMVKLNADNARAASNLSQQSRQSAEEGESEIKKLNEAVNEIAQSSAKIEEIINVIDDIAFQTNLLALNAAVEAARAGEQGKGFAVVAEAVRALAQRSASAAKDITALIKESVAKIDRGAKIADEGGKVLRNIVVSVKKVSELNNEIATASQEQSNGLTQISKAMNELDQATQRNAASAEETAASSEEMSGQASSLAALVATLNKVIEGGQAAAMITETRPLATVTPLKKKKQPDARAVLPLDDGELARRKVSNIEGF